MSALHSIKKNMRRIDSREQDYVDRRIVRGDYQSSRRDRHAAQQRIDDRAQREKYAAMLKGAVK